MNTLIKFWGIASVATAALLMSATASAAVACPESATGNAVELTEIVGGPPTCVPAGTGDGNENAFPFFDDKNLLWKYEGSGSEGSGPNPFISFSPLPVDGNALSGSFELVAGLTNHYLVFKFGQGNTNPNLITFAINGMTEADWELIPCTGNDAEGEAYKCNGLSHVSIWGPGVTVPEPGTLALMGLGLVAVGYRVRRRQKI